jgi:hypothetical protein
MSFLVLCSAASGGEVAGDVGTVVDGDQYNLIIGAPFPSSA